jgi:hypothetical protein
MSVVLYPEIGPVYRHYKGGLYTIITLANHTETGEPMVVYKSELFGSVYVRPLSMWFERVKDGDDDVQRFKKA